MIVYKCLYFRLKQINKATTQIVALFKFIKCCFIQLEE